MAPHSSTLAWKRLPWMESLEGCSPWGRWGSHTTERLHFHFSLSCIGEGNGNPLQCSYLENPRDGEAWWAAVYGVAKSRTQLKRLSSSSSSSRASLIAQLANKRIYIIFLDYTYGKIYNICCTLSELLHSVWQSLSPTVLLQMVLFHSFNGWVIFHCMYVPHLLYSSLCWWTLGSFHVLAVANSTAMNTGVLASFLFFLQMYAQEWDCRVIWQLYV